MLWRLQELFWGFYSDEAGFAALSMRFDPQAITLRPRALFSIFFAAFSSALALKWQFSYANSVRFFMTPSTGRPW